MPFFTTKIQYAPIIALLLFANLAFSQNKNTQSFPKPFIVKTNLLNLLAQKPTISFEKVFSQKFSAEISFVQGEVNNFLFTDHYAYKGIQLRFKRYFFPFQSGKLNPFSAVYLGNLQRHIQSEGRYFSDNYLFSYPSKDFFANSIRGGLSLGCTIITKNKLAVEILTSTGYGRYTTIYKADTNHKSKGYLDAQIWLSVGYSF